MAARTISEELESYENDMEQGYLFMENSRKILQGSKAFSTSCMFVKGHCPSDTGKRERSRDQSGANLVHPILLRVIIRRPIPRGPSIESMPD